MGMKGDLIPKGLESPLWIFWKLGQASLTFFYFNVKPSNKKYILRNI